MKNVINKQTKNQAQNRALKSPLQGVRGLECYVNITGNGL